MIIPNVRSKISFDNSDADSKKPYTKTKNFEIDKVKGIHLHCTILLHTIY